MAEKNRSYKGCDLTEIKRDRFNLKPISYSLDDGDEINPLKSVYLQGQLMAQYHYLFLSLMSDQSVSNNHHNVHLP